MDLFRILLHLMAEIIFGIQQIIDLVFIVGRYLKDILLVFWILDAGILKHPFFEGNYIVQSFSFALECCHDISQLLTLS